ncbi:MAG: hypothetical protein LUC37_06545 [Prevotella sp.]|nr:hypothetical protein [Prevotella sp.]
MKIRTSYFYQIRFFKPNMIPLSTAAFDPKWFHDYQGKYYQFKDKRGIWNGLRAESFCASNAIAFDECGCPFCEEKDPDKCEFLRRYRMYLDTLSFDEMYQRFERLSKEIQKYDGFKEEPIMVLIFYETPKNRCSERTEVLKWFHSHDYPIKELDYPI